MITLEQINAAIAAGEIWPGEHFNIWYRDEVIASEDIGAIYKINRFL